MRDLKITIIQTSLHWENMDANLRMFDQKLASIKRLGDVVVLPEMFTSGFTMQPKRIADKAGGKTLQWLKDKARAYSVDITASAAIEDNGRYFNRMYWVKPDGSFEFYDKRHLFRMAGEHKIYSSGNRQLRVECKGWKIAPYVCYDLRFPVWTRNTLDGYDAAIFVANWPERRAAHWRLLLKARAIDNQAYVVGVNRVGTDGNGIYYRGDSAVLDPLGKPLFEKAHQEAIKTITLEAAPMQNYRKRFPVWKDSDTFKIGE